MFGHVSSMNPGTIGHRMELNAIKPNVRKPGTSVGRMMQHNNIITSTPTPSSALPQQRSLKRLSQKKFF